MPWEISFKQRAPAGREAIVERLLPFLRSWYQDVRSGKDFIRCRDGDVSLAIDVLGDDRLRLTSSRKRLLFGSATVDTPQLDALESFVIHELDGWTEGKITAKRV